VHLAHYVWVRRYKSMELLNFFCAYKNRTCDRIIFWAVLHQQVYIHILIGVTTLTLGTDWISTS
jgi:hypothetical protein